MPLYADVLLVRHGESEANRSGQLARRSWDPPLTQKGVLQSERLATQLITAPVHYIVTSPLLRARETVAPLSRIHHIQPITLDDLAEVDLGAWDGRRLKDLETANLPDFMAWRKDPEANPPPGGENIVSVGERVLATLESFLENHRPSGLTVAATHADCIKGAVLVVLQTHGPASRHILVPNAGQLLLRHFDRGRWTIMFSPLCQAEDENQNWD